MKAATAKYKAEMDVLASFIEERCVVKAGAWAKFADLYGAYEEWCRESGELAEKKRTFGARLKERGFRPEKGAGNVSTRSGIALLSGRNPDPDGPRRVTRKVVGLPKRLPRVTRKIPAKLRKTLYRLPKVTLKTAQTNRT